MKLRRWSLPLRTDNARRPWGLGRMGGNMKWTSAPPPQRSRRWSPQVRRIGNSTIIIVLLCKQDCTPSRHYINFVFGLSQPLAARPTAYHLIKDKYKYPSFTSVRLGIESLGYNTNHLFFRRVRSFPRSVGECWKKTKKCIFLGASEASQEKSACGPLHPPHVDIQKKKKKCIFQARAKLPKKRRRVVNVDVSEVRRNRNRTRNGASKISKLGIGTKLGMGFGLGDHKYYSVSAYFFCYLHTWV